MEILENLYNSDFDVFKLVLKFVEYKKNYNLVINELRKQIQLKKCIEINEIYLDQQQTKIDIMYSMDRDSDAEEELEDFTINKKQIIKQKEECKFNNYICFDCDDFHEIKDF